MIAARWSFPSVSPGFHKPAANKSEYPVSDVEVAEEESANRRISVKQRATMRIILLEHPSDASPLLFNDIANTPL